jgi:hypothetical protein
MMRGVLTSEETEEVKRKKLVLERMRKFFRKIEFGEDF